MSTDTELKSPIDSFICGLATGTTASCVTPYLLTFTVGLADHQFVHMKQLYQRVYEKKKKKKKPKPIFTELQISL